MQIPFCIISVLNVLTINTIRYQQKIMNKNQKSKDGKMTNLTITMFAVCIVFLITTLPIFVDVSIHLLSEFLGTDFIKTDILPRLIALRMDSINHSVNFLLYCITGSVFRQTLILLFQSCRRK